MRPVMEPSLVGNRFKLVSLLHRDDDLATYAALDQDSGNRPVLVKLLPAEQASSPAARDAFRHGVDRARQMQHSGIAALLAADSDVEQPFFVEARPSGKCLQDWLDGGQTWVWDECLTMIESLAETVAAIHRAGLVHGAINGHSVFIAENGRVELCDLARSTPPATDRPNLLHAAPEAMSGATPTPRSDVYSLASIGFTLLTGGPPFDRRDATALRRVKVATDPPSLVRLRPDLPDALVTAIDAGLAREPSLRPGSAAAFRDALRHGLPAIVVREPARSPWPAVLAGLSALTALVVVGWLLLTAPVPNVLGLSQAEARRALDETGLDSRIVADADRTTAAPGTVTGQSPLPGKRVSRGFDVALTVAGAGMTQAPALLGMTESAARQTLADRGLRLGRIDIAPAPGVPLGQVIGQAPLAGETVSRGGYVSLMLSGDAAKTIVVPVIEDGIDPDDIPVPQVNVTITAPPAPATPATGTASAGPVIDKAPAPGVQATPSPLAEPEPPAVPEPPEGGPPQPPPPGDGEPQPVPPNRPQPPTGPVEPLAPGANLGEDG